MHLHSQSLPIRALAANAIHALVIAAAKGESTAIDRAIRIASRFDLGTYFLTVSRQEAEARRRRTANARARSLRHLPVAIAA